MFCPECGGSQVRQVGPGRFQCDSLVLVDVVPPEVTGYGPVPQHRVCGHRFKMGTLDTSSEACGFCTRLSMGTCGDCGRPLCHVHGTSRGAFLCQPCVRTRLAAEKREEERRREVVQKERAEVNAAIAACRDPGQLVGLLTEYKLFGSGDLEACKSAWIGLASEGAIEPSHDIVTVAGDKHLVKFGSRPRGDVGRNWRETERVPGWHAPNVAAPCGLGVWLDADGGVFQNGGGGRAGPSKTLFLPATKIVLPRGGPLRLSPWFGSLGAIQFIGNGERNVEGGFLLYPRTVDPLREASEYAQVVLDIIRIDGRC
jgi:hypothetical protein